MDDVPQFDLYGILGVSSGATGAAIETAFRAAAKREHPDTSPDPSGATRRMQRLNVARDWLTDSDRRARYDRARGVRESHAPRATIPEIDPLGAWPDHRPPTAATSARPSSVIPAIALVAVMIMLTGLVAGPGSLVASGIMLAGFVVFIFALLATLLGALR